MVLRIFKWLLLAVILLLAGAALLLQWGASRALDHGFLHSASVAALPEYRPGATDGEYRIRANGQEFRTRLANLDSADADRELVILLHGFPQTSAMWENLIPPLLEQDFAVLAFDQRGYSPGARPHSVSEYSIALLAEDVLAMADAVGASEFHLVGHDWGAVVGWTTVINHPERTRSWTALSIAHPAAFAEAARNDPDQRSKSSYFLLFAAPWLPDTLFAYDDFHLLKTMYTAMSDTQRAEYLRVLAEPGALRAAFNWYRAAVQNRNDEPEIDTTVTTPTLFIWGRNDPAAGRVAVEATADYMKGPYQKLELEAGHWLMEEATGKVVSATLDHLKRQRLPPRQTGGRPGE
jgi:pimeloyl-ACP methyl ester carboxylesterase